MIPLLPSFYLLYSLEYTMRASYYVEQTFKEYKVIFHLLEVSLSTKLFRIICINMCLLFPIFLFLKIIHLYQFGFKDIYFVLWVTMQFFFVLFFRSKCFDFVHWELFQVAPMSLWHISIIAGFLWPLPHTTILFNLPHVWYAL